MNVHVWVVFLLFEAFHTLLEYFSCLKKLNLKIEVEQTQQVLLEYLRCIKVDELHLPRLAVKVVAVVMGLDVSVCNFHRVQVLNCCRGIVESYQYAFVVNIMLGRRSFQGDAKQLHRKCRKRHFVECKHCCNVGMLQSLHHLELGKKFHGHRLGEICAQDALQGARGSLRSLRSLHFQFAWKDHPRSTFGELDITGEEFKPVIGVIAFLGRKILCFDLEGFAQRVRARNHLWLLRSQKHGRHRHRQNLWLSCPLLWLLVSCPLLWLLGPKIVKQTLYRIAGRPWAVCSMDFSKPFWFREHREGRPRMDARFLYHICVGYTSWMYVHVM